MIGADNIIVNTGASATNQSTGRLHLRNKSIKVYRKEMAHVI